MEPVPPLYPSLLCLENPLLDIQSFGDQALLQKYGLKPNDAILAEEKHLGIYDDLIENYGAELTAGGGAQNTARGAQYLLPPSSVVYIGCVGRDKYAEILGSACANAGVHVEYRVDDDHPTGRCGVVITDHNRSLCTDLGAANHYRIDHLKQPHVWSLVEKANYLFVGGYHLTVCPTAIMELAKEAAAQDKVFMLSFSAPFIPHAFKDALDETAPYWDYLVGNESEAIAYADSHDWKTHDIPEIAQRLATLPKKNTKRSRVVIITLGSLPTIVAVSGVPGVKVYPIRPIAPSEIVDTTGAGDAFAGGFVAGLIKGKSLETAIDMGHWLANVSIRILGPNYPTPKQLYVSPTTA